MGGLSIWHWLVLGAVVLLLFGGRGKISGMMGDLADVASKRSSAA